MTRGVSRRRQLSSAGVAKRREIVMQVADGNMTLAEIAEVVGATESCVSKDIYALRDMGRSPKLAKRQPNKIDPATVAKIQRLNAEGLPQYKIAVECGVSEYSVRTYTGRSERRSDPQKKATAPIASDVVVYADGGRTTVSHGIGPESARRMALAMSRGREVVSHTVEGP